jgi:hypothetical protein
MRIAVYEMMCCGDIPVKVSINEAVDIGKKFGTEESGAFINGIVDSIRVAIEKGEVSLPCGEVEPKHETVPKPEKEAAPLVDPSPSGKQDRGVSALPQEMPREKRKPAHAPKGFIRRKKTGPLPLEEKNDH